MNSAERTHPPQLPQIVSVIATVIFTLFVGVCSAFTLYITYAHFNTQKGWIVCAMSVGSVCFFAGYCWYRIFTEPPPVTLQFQEQTEGVWPPAPVMTTKRDNL